MTSKLAADPTDSAKPIRAMLDVMGGDRDPSGNLIDRINPRRFGKDRGRILRKAVLLAIAKNCQPDGSGAFPSIETIAHRCLVSKRAAIKAIQWMEKHRLIHIEKRAVRVGKFSRLNRYQILFNAPRKRQKPKTEPSAIEVHQATDSLVNISTEPGEHYAKPGELKTKPGEIGNDTRTSSLERPTERKRERPASKTVAPPFSETKPPAKEESHPENGQQEYAFIALCAELCRIGGESFTGKYRTMLYEMTKGWSHAEILAAYRGFIEYKDDFQMKHAVQEFCAGGAIDCLTNRRKAAEQQARNDEAVRIQQEAARREAEIEAERRRQEEEAGNEILARLGIVPMASGEADGAR